MKNLKRIRDIQRKTLFDILRRNEHTEFGKKHRFERIKKIEDFKSYVPIRTYKEYLPWIEKITKGAKNVLTREKILIFEPTSGTTSGTKLIPYTYSLKQEFLKAINTWIFDLIKNNFSVISGKSYWSISPVLNVKRSTEGGIPIGFEDDTEYLGWKRKIFTKLLAVPSWIKNIKDIRNFWYTTAYYLLITSNLSIISIWNPTYLLLLLQTIESEIEHLLRDIYNGTICLSHSESISLLKTKPLPERAKQIEKVFHLPFKYTKIWKKLKIISCWKDGPSEYYAKKLERIFKGVYIQGKGLIATEGIITIPIISFNGSIPAYTSHFIEFIPLGERVTKTVDELETGETYSIVITTGGGLYRYNLEDRVKVIKKYGDVPVLKFVGRERYSDIVGEKLEETFVKQVLEKTFRNLGINAQFVLLAPEQIKQNIHYVLFIEIPFEVESEKILKVKERVEKELMKNYHYEYARKLGQLKPLKIFVIKNNGFEKYIKRYHEEGQKIGDIKPSFIDKRFNWSEYFDGYFL